MVCPILRPASAALATLFASTFASAQLTLEVPSIPIPPVATITSPQMFFDAATNQLCLADVTGTFQLTYSPTANSWTLVAAAPPGVARIVGGNPPMAFDLATNSAFALSGGAWVSIPVNSPPPPGTSAIDAFARLPSGNILHFGGISAGAPSSDTFLFDVSTSKWAAIVTPNTPPARAGMAICGTDTGAIMTGGFDSVTALGDTWVFDEATLDWTNIPSATLPTAVAFCQMTWNPRLRQAVVQGGLEFVTTTFLQDIAVLDPNASSPAWQKLNSGTAAVLPTLAYSPAHDEIVLLDTGNPTANMLLVHDLSSAQFIGVGCRCTSNPGNASLLMTQGPVRIGSFPTFFMFRANPAITTNVVLHLSTGNFGTGVALPAPPFSPACFLIVDPNQIVLSQTMTFVAGGFFMRTVVGVPNDLTLVGLSLTAQAIQLNSPFGGVDCTTNSQVFSLRR